MQLMEEEIQQLKNSVAQLSKFQCYITDLIVILPLFNFCSGNISIFND